MHNKLILSIALFLLPQLGWAKDVYTQTLVQTTVQAIIDGTAQGWDSPSGGSQVSAVVDGDIVHLPAGTSLGWVNTSRTCTEGNQNQSATAAIHVCGNGGGGTTGTPKNITISGTGTDAATGGTKITGSSNTNPKGFFNLVTANTDSTMRLTNLNINITNEATENNPNETGAITIDGIGKVHLVGGIAKGGFRIDHVRVTAQTNLAGGSNYFWVTKGWASGVIDHNFIDYPAGTDHPGSEMTDITMSSSATGGTTSLGTPATKGDYSWYNAYTIGGTPGNPDTDATYIEDNIIHKIGVAIGSATGMGSRVVVRHNTAWGGISGHGMETGNNAGVRNTEYYNNRIEIPSNTSTGFNVHNTRSGGLTVFNERLSHFPNTGAATMSFFRPGGNSSMVGPGDGTNFYDKNTRGTIVHSDHTFIPGTDPNSFVDTSDSPNNRVGDVYDSGTSTLTKLTGVTWKMTFSQAPTTDQWKGFTLRNFSASAPASSGGQDNSQSQTGGHCTLIIGNIAGNPSTITIEQPADTPFTIAPGQRWEIRHVDQFMNIVGSGKMDSLLDGNFWGSGGALGSQNKAPLLVNGSGPTNSPNPRWTNQTAVGVYVWSNKYRPGSSANSSADPCFASNTGPCAFVPATSIPNIPFYITLVPGGVHEDETNSPPSPSAVRPGYPKPYTSGTPTPAMLRIGAEDDCTGHVNNDCAQAMRPEFVADDAWGAPYPHPLVSGLPNPTPSPTPPPTPTPTPTATSTPTPAATPVFTSTTSTTFTQNVANSFNVTITAAPPTTISQSGTLPSGITFANNGTNIAILSGTPTGTGTFPLVFSATNSGGTTTQNFSLVVSGAPPPTPPSNIVITNGPIAIGQAKAGPTGTYLLSSGKTNASNPATNSTGAAINNANCDGVRWKIVWSDVEQTPGSFTWTYLDAAVALIPAGKHCGIELGAGIGCPAWLFAAPYSAASYTLQDSSGNAGLKVPVPGDAVFMTRWQQFVNAAGARYDGNPKVSFVVIGGIGNHDEWNLADGPLDTAALGKTQAQVNTWKSSSKQIIDFHMTAFPTTVVMGELIKPFLASAQDAGVEDPNNSMIEVSDYARTTYGKHFAYAFNSLAPTSSSSYPPINQIISHYATNWTWAQFATAQPDQTLLDQTLRNGVDFHLRGCEIYKPTFNDSTLQSYTVPSGAFAGQAGGITPRRADYLAIPPPQ